MILNGRNIDGLRASRIATLTRRRFVAGVACAVACAAAGLLVAFFYARAMRKPAGKQR